MKICSKCKTLKNLDNFSKHKRNKDGYEFHCKSCRKATYQQSKAFYQNYYQQNKDKILIYNANYKAEQYKTNIDFRLTKILRSRLYMAIKNNQKIGSAIADLGCSIEHLKNHIQALFKPGMTWDNYGYDGWHLDHIVPLSSFDLTDREQFLKACHYTNLQPLWAEDNYKKGKSLLKSTT